MEVVIMKKGFIAAGLTTLGLLLSGCNFKLFNKSQYTIMVYMCGADLESESGLASSDIYEMCFAENKPSNVNIIVQTGGSPKWSNGKVNPKKTQRWHVSNGELVLDAELPKANFGTSETFESFMEWGLKKYPAKKTGVILWNHGGAMAGVCSDNNYGGDTLLCSEVTDALSEAFKNTGRKEKLEWIGYDACLMQVQDIAEANSDYFNYMVASQESEAGEGWVYHKWLSTLFNKKTTEEVLTKVCDSFVEATKGSYNNQTLSFLDLNKMPEYKDAWETLSKKVSSTIPSSEKENFKNMMKTVNCYGTMFYSRDEIINYLHLSLSPLSTNYFGNYGIEEHDGTYIDYGYNSFGVFDVKDFLNKLGNTYSEFDSEISSVNKAFSDLVVYNKAGAAAGESYGLCLFFPMTSRCRVDSYYNEKQTRFDSWRDVTLSLGGK